MLLPSMDCLQREQISAIPYSPSQTTIFIGLNIFNLSKKHASINQFCGMVFVRLLFIFNIFCVFILAVQTLRGVYAHLQVNAKNHPKDYKISAPCFCCLHGVYYIENKNLKKSSIRNIFAKVIRYFLQILSGTYLKTIHEKRYNSRN